MDRLLAVVATLLTLAACANDSERRTGSPTTTSPATSTTVRTGAGETTTSSATRTVDVALRIERRVSDEATASFDEVVRATLVDDKGWQRAGFRFTFGGTAPYTVVLAEGDEVDRLCAPYDVGGRFSCQNGPVVALNADRWRTATEKWTGDLATYRQMLVNHEVGHLLGQHHPEVQCPAAGQPAPVMAQQSTELDGCLPNPWPLDWEIVCAARHEEPLAPGYEVAARSTCGP